MEPKAVEPMTNAECAAAYRRVPEEVRPAQPAKDAEVIPEHEETVTEYVCAPFLQVPETV